MICVTNGSVVLWRFELLSQFGSVVHAVTGRHGGVSEQSYASLNLGLHVGDEPVSVIENRRRVSEALGVDFETMTFAQQVHGDLIQVVSRRQAGVGRTRFEEGVAATDGVIVREPGITIAVFVADCAPLLLYDPEHHAAAAVHAGWRGTAVGIAAKAVRVMAEECGTRPETLVAGIGPTIGRCCYRVSEEVARGVRAAEQRGDHWYADVAEANRQQLIEAGMRDGNIELSGLCTSCRADDFYSERKLGRPTGRFAAFIALG